MNKELKDLVKKHFDLVDAPSTEETVVSQELAEAVVEETLTEENVETTFETEIKTADGELTLYYDGEELAEGLAIFVITEDGNIPAPDGTHALAGDITITTEGGLITSVSADEVEDEVEVEAETEEEMSEEESNQELGELHEALIKAMASEFKEQIATLKEEFNTQIKAVKEEFGAQPAAEKTITNKKETYGRSNTANIAYNPSDSKKAAQFDRLLKARKN